MPKFSNILFSIKLSYFRNFYTVALFFIFIMDFSFASIREFETTRLKSTAGAGVGSVLMDESAILNPGSIGLYTISSIYFQKNSGEFQNKDLLGPSHHEFSDTAVIASDAKGAAAGSFAYINQKRGDESRRTLALAMAKPFREDSSLGVSYRRIKEEVYLDGSLREESYNEFSLGVTHAINTHFTYGVVIEDPFKSRNDDTYATIGFHYLFHDYIALMLDLGADYTKQLSETYSYRLALQVMFFNDFFFRVGHFKDELRQEQGTGLGVNWVGPKLVFELATKKTEVDLSGVEQNQDIKETSFSVAYKF